MRRLALLIAPLCACDLVWLEAPSACERDDFSGTLSTSWNASPVVDPMPRIENEQLVVPFNPTGVLTAITSARPHDFTGRQVQVTIVDALDVTLITDEATFFAVGDVGFTTNDSHHAFVVYPANNRLMLEFRAKEKDVPNQPMTVDFSPTVHKHWRFVHALATNEIQAWTSETGEAANWQLRFSAPATISSSAVQYVIGNVGFGSATETATYDDFEVCELD